MRHLGAQVLAEAQALGLDTELGHEGGGARHKVAERLVVNELARDGGADGRHDELAVADLRRGGKEVEHGARERGELGVRLLLGVHKVLDFRHRELAHADEPAARRDLVAVRGADLRDGHGHAPAVVVVQAAEVDKHALRRLGPQEARERARGPDRRREHEVEGKARREVRARRGRLDAQLRKERVERRGLVRVRLRRNLAQLLAPLRRHQLVRLRGG